MENSLPFVWQPNACIPEPSTWIQLVGSTSMLAVVSDLARDGIETPQALLSESHCCSVRLVVILYLIPQLIGSTIALIVRTHSVSFQFGRFAFL
jgi:hypothetical protein